MERSKFAPEVPLQLLLLLLLLWVSYERGALGEEIYEVEHRMVGETLTVRCQYTALKPDHLEKAWCKKKRNTNTCTLLITRPKPLSKTENPRYSLSYNTSVIMVNMSDLQVEDSGEYWCGNNNSTVNVIAIFKRIHLIVAPAQTQNTTPLNSDTAVKSTTMIEDLTITSSTIRPQFKATVVTDIQLPENSTSRSQVVDHVVSEDLRVMGTVKK
ncbi:trem-like transcript 4 protein isoform X2 [Dromiciops gliroides]|uniref:trem-like transcript 4 protein isoform X2 n=1 Tax=Dromiciops gliroides TaxID=33562 RepID=UPI001CC79AE5|nr:trem-like transcript 4 protein isoform X2 [Dromiciops gliroides]